MLTIIKFIKNKHKSIITTCFSEIIMSVSRASRQLLRNAGFPTFHSGKSMYCMTAKVFISTKPPAMSKSPVSYSFFYFTNKSYFCCCCEIKYTYGAHRSNAEELINKVPVIEVDGHLAVCDGGGGALGHPVEYIQLDTISKEPAICKYCGLRFRASHGDHHH